MKSHRFLGVALLTCCSLMARPTCANSVLGADEGKFLLTAGFSDLEGTGGGGLVPFAFISGYGSSDSWGANAHVTNVELRDYHVYTYGVAVGFLDRVELTYTHQQLNITSTALNGLGVRQEVVGAKLKLCGNAVYQQDSPLPQIAAGVEYKHNDGIKNAADVGLAGLISPIQLGATAVHAADYYLAATKVFLAQSVVVNVVLRETKANQFGFLGFGGDRKKNYSLRPEGTLAYLLTRRFAVGAEIRSAPSNLSVDNETAAWDAFAAWAPTKNISLVAAYLNLGSILAPVTHVARHQDGAYLSIQVGF